MINRLIDPSWLRDGIFSRSRGFGIGNFYFGLDRKIPKIPKNFEFLRFSGHRDFLGFSENSWNLWQIFGIRDFMSLGILNPRGFREISGIYAKSPEFGIFYPRDFPEIFYRRDRDFSAKIFVGCDIPKKANSAHRL